MRGPLVVVVGLAGGVAACGGSSSTPAHLEPAGQLTFITVDTPATFDTHDSLVMMDASSGLRRLVGNRLVAVSGGGSFTFGRFGTDRDGAVLMGSLGNALLARLEDDDTVTLINPQVPTGFDTILGAPSGSYYISSRGVEHSLVLPPGGAAWVDSGRLLDRTLRAPDGEVYAIENGDVVRLGTDDSPTPVGACSDFSGGLCTDLELAGVDADGGLTMGRVGNADVHVLDPGTGTFAEIDLPGALQIDSIAAGSQYTLVVADDPDRGREQSLWILLQGTDELLRIASLQLTSVPPIPLVDHAGNGFVIVDDQLQAVVVDR